MPEGEPSDAAERGPAQAESKGAAPPTDAPGLALAVDTFRITRGSLEAPPWALENLELQGRLRADGSAELRFDAELPGLGRLIDTEVDLANLGGDSLSRSRERGDLDSQRAPVGTLSGRYRRRLTKILIQRWF